MNIPTPIKPFDEYKWRWAEFTPSEGLNHPARFLGVLRVLKANEGQLASSESFHSDLLRTEAEIDDTIGGNINLSRTLERNLIRSSGRYWKALGVLTPSTSIITLTDFGNKIANGDITKSEFAIATINNLKLPNRRIEQDATIRLWEAAGLEIKPLRLLLEVMRFLYEKECFEEAFITSDELAKVIVPLAGINVNIDVHAEALLKYRRNDLDITHWPNCSEGANDKRMLREFLLFLKHYKFCNCKHEARVNSGEKFYFTEYAYSILDGNLNGQEENLDELIENIRSDEIFFEGERERILIEAAKRSGQAKFRREVLNRYNSTCIISSYNISKVLHACHIVPFEDNGLDEVNNSLCLRADIHILYDSGNLRIDPSGKLSLSEEILNKRGYNRLPERIEIPDFVSIEAIRWRWNYL
ncbi:MAG: HNH endonuclease signature motif containing protein [Candidatus Paceibacterota bacterium]